MIFVDTIKDKIEESKEYVVYRRTIGGYVKTYLDKKQLQDYINQNHLADLDIYKTKDLIKLKRTLEIEEE